MFRQLTYKQKFRVLAVGSILFGLLVYQYAIVKTIDIYRQNKELEQKIADAVTAPAKVKKLTQQLAQLDGLVQSKQTDTSANVHDLLLGFVSGYCKEKQIILKSFPETNVSQKQEFEIQTHEFAVQGNFTTLLQLVYLLEQKQRIGKISSLSFQSSKDIDTKQTILVATVYLQNIKKIKS